MKEPVWEDLLKASDNEKIVVLQCMRERITGVMPLCFFDIAKSLVADKNNDIRWQALIVIGEYIPEGTKNDDIWDLIERLCGIDDMQNALSTVLLEHLLEYDYDNTCRRINSVTEEKSQYVQDLLDRCWSFSPKTDYSPKTSTAVKPIINSAGC